MAIRFSIVLVALCLALSLPSARAQVDDPLYPLEIGAVWEYETYRESFGYGISMLGRERREVVGDTVVTNEVYRIVRLLTGSGAATSWTPQARCAVRVNRSSGAPVIEWAAVTGTCAPPEDGLALTNVQTGTFEVRVVDDTIAFSRGILNDVGYGWKLVEGIGRNHVISNDFRDVTQLTYVHLGGIEAGRRYVPGWWHYLVRLEAGDLFQYRNSTSSEGGQTVTYDQWSVRGDTLVDGIPRRLVEQRAYGEDQTTLVRHSLCGVAKGVSDVSTLTLQGGTCTGIVANNLPWFTGLRDVEVLGDLYPGSYFRYGATLYTLIEFADPLGYVRRESVTSGGPGGNHLNRFALHYAIVDGVEYGSPVVAGEQEPAASRPELRVRPNPFRTTLDVDVANTGAAVAAIEVFDILGRRLLQAELLVPGSREIDVSALASGTYVVRTTLDDGTILTRTATKVR